MELMNPMASHSSLTLLPNPTTPLAFLPATVARQLEICRYIWAAFLGAWIWDVALSFKEEFHMMKGFKFKAADVVYFLARISSGGFAITALCFVASPVSNCQMFAKIVGSFAALSLPFNSLLFIFRVRGVFHGNQYVVGFFCLLWLGISASSIFAPFSVHGMHIGTTRYCIPTKITTDVSIAMTISAVNDTLVFIAITVRLMMFSLENTWKERIKMLLRAQSMGSVSTIVLQSGQLYYMATVGINFVAAVVILMPSFPPVYRAMFTFLNITLQNSMACRVYRQLKIGLIRDLEMSSVEDETLGTIRFATNPAQTNYSERRRRSGVSGAEGGHLSKHHP